MTSNSFLLPTREWKINPIYEGSADAQRRLSKVLNQIYNDEYYQGHSDVGIRNLIHMLVVSTSPHRTLEVGGHLGAAALVIGTALEMNNFGHHYVLEPNDVYYARLTGYVDAAQLANRVTVIRGFSTDEEVVATVKNLAPFQLIFIDAHHSYDAALHDLTVSMDLLEDNGFIVLHDTSELAASYDSTGKGGVRQAILELCRQRKDAKPVFFEWPLWMNQTGAALVVKQNLDTQSS